MAHFALMEGDTVATVNCVANDAIENAEFPESETLGQELLARSGFEGTWLQCSYSGSFRGAYPGPGWTYDSVLDEFLPPASNEETP